MEPVRGLGASGVSASPPRTTRQAVRDRAHYPLVPNRCHFSYSKEGTARTKQPLGDVRGAQTGKPPYEPDRIFSLPSLRRGVQELRRGVKGTCVFVLRLQWGSQPEDFQSRGARSLRGTTRTPDRFLPVSRCRRFSPPLFPFLLDFLPTPRSVQPHVDRFTLSLPTASEGVQRRAQAEIVLERV